MYLIGYHILMNEWMNDRYKYKYYWYIDIMTMAATYDVWMNSQDLRPLQSGNGNSSKV